MTPERNNPQAKIAGWKNIVRLAPQAILSFDGEGRIVQWNARCARLFGYSWEEIRRQPLDELIISGQWTDSFREELSRFGSLSKEYPYLLLVTRGKNKNGVEFAMKMNIFKIQVNNKPVLTSFISMEPSNNQHSADSSPAVELMKQLGHDVKNALTSIQLLTQIALRNKELELAPHTKDFLTKIDSQSVKLGGLVNDLLDISRIHSDRLTIKKQAIDFKPFWEDILAKSQAILTSQKSMDEEVPVIQVHLDPFRIRQAITCILEHGKKNIEGLQGVAMEAGTDAGELQVRIHFDHSPSEGGEQTFTGLDPLTSATDQPLDPAMFITARSIELHQGTTGVQHHPDGGTTVRFTLPV